MVVDKGAQFTWHIVAYLSWQLRVGLIVRIQPPIINTNCP
jgi:hypothetical protein